MARRHWHPSKCKDCGIGRPEGVTISQAGLCMTCAKRRHWANTDQIRAKQGPYFARWARRSFMAARQAMIAAERGEA